MTIPLIVDTTEDFEKRLWRAATIGMIEKLEAAAKEALTKNDRETHQRMQAEAEELRQQYLNTKDDAGNGIRPQRGLDGQVIHGTLSNRVLAPLDTKRIEKEWAALGAERIFSTDNAMVFDCGQRGKVLITQTNIFVKGQLIKDLTVKLLATRHIQLHWEGNPYYFLSSSPNNAQAKFEEAVATEILGGKVLNCHIPPSRRMEAEALKAQMHQILDDIYAGRVPTRPDPLAAKMDPAIIAASKKTGAQASGAALG
ncbi:MAG: hypothetical protein SFW65_00255 [Alphaproteobacteria bacterium]|nr:hypothetical protein [Alphaproteobacteria bacterium]